jgi:oligopeptide transport system ATP-binding protein
MTFLGQKEGLVRAVDGVDIAVYRGETLALVGESGCGKSTAGRAILQLHKPTSGHVYLEDVDLAQASASQVRTLRPRMQMIFQDPYASLDPRKTVERIIGEKRGGYVEGNSQW